MGDEAGTIRLLSRELANPAMQICFVSAPFLQRFISLLFYKFVSQGPKLPKAVNSKLCYALLFPQALEDSAEALSSPGERTKVAKRYFAFFSPPY